MADSCMGISRKMINTAPKLIENKKGDIIKMPPFIGSLKEITF